MALKGMKTAKKMATPLLVLCEKDLSLGRALDRLKQKFQIDERMIEGLHKLYKFASDVSGIRHGNNKVPMEISFAEAKLMLLICSSLINYLSSFVKK